MDAIKLGTPNLFVKGVAEQTFYDPTTGNVVGYDNVASESAITSSVNLQEIAGGMGNALIGVIPDTTRLTGSYTSQAFSLYTRQLITGGRLSYGGVGSVCETITATKSTLTVSQTPAKHYGQPTSDVYAWCYVKEHNSSEYMGTNYGVDIATKEVQDFIAVAGTQYDVIYFTVNTSAQELAIPDSFNPSVVTVQTKYGVYSKQNNSVSGGTFQGWLIVVVPQAILSGDAGLNANQTTNATTDGSWMAVTPDQTAMTCSSCGVTSNDFAYYVYVPCGDTNEAVDALAVVGGGVTVAVSGTAQIPVKYVMPDNSLQQPTYTDLTYTSENTATATVSESGMVTGVAAGSTKVTITLTKAGGTTLTTICTVTVS